jgi:hypothetical protein
MTRNLVKHFIGVAAGSMEVCGVVERADASVWIRTAEKCPLAILAMVPAVLGIVTESARSTP